MKKYAKKFISLLVAVLMLLPMSCGVVFADDTGKITINNAVENQKYSIYKLLDLESYNAGSNAYSYKVNTAWENFFKGEGAKWVNIDEQNYVTVKPGFDDSTAETFAKEALAYAKANNIAAAAGPVTKTKDNTIEFNNLPLGYYLIDSSLGTLCSLTTTNPTQNVNDKNGQPTIDKKVQKNPGTSWGDWNDATIGEVVNFSTSIRGKKGAENYVVHDKMQDSLTMDYNSIKISYRGGEITKDKYEVVNTGLTDGCTFEIRFTKEFCDTVVDDELIVITYSATLNDKAVIVPNANINETRLEYGEKNYTEWDQTRTYTYKVQIVKTTNETEGNKVLQGAQFKLYYGSDKKEIKVYKVSDGVYRPITDGTQTAVTIEAGTPVIMGLDSGTYYLEETVAPAGYNKLAGHKEFKVGDPLKETDTPDEPTSDSYNVMAVLAENNTKWTSGGVQVINQTGTKMPETGARGTIIFVAFGTIVALCGYVLLVSKKRMEAETDL